MDANHKFDTTVVFTFLGNEKEYILCCLNRERQQLHTHTHTHTQNLMKTKIQKQFVPEEARYKYNFFKKTSKKEKYNPIKNIHMYLKD